MHYKNVDKVIRELRVHFANDICFYRSSQGGFGEDTDLGLKYTIGVWLNLLNANCVFKLNAPNVSNTFSLVKFTQYWKIGKS